MITTGSFDKAIKQSLDPLHPGVVLKRFRKQEPSSFLDHAGAFKVS